MCPEIFNDTFFQYCQRKLTQEKHHVGGRARHTDKCLAMVLLVNKPDYH